MPRTIHVIEHWRIAEPDYGRRHLAGRGFDVRVAEPWKGEALPDLSGDEAGVMLMGGPQYVTDLDDAPYLQPCFLGLILCLSLLLFLRLLPGLSLSLVLRLLL